MQQVSPGLVQWLANLNQKKEELLNEGFKLSPINAREALAALTFGLVTDRPALSWVQDELLPAEPYNVPVRIYHPDYPQRLPVLIFFHGGGHMAGSVSVYDAINRKLALASNRIVVAAEYRLAPECPYPAAVTDACNVVKHVFSALDSRCLAYIPERLSVAGDSGGGALCATAVHTCQNDPDIRLHRQVLIYPSLDYTLAWPSIENYGAGYLLEKDKIQWYFDNYFQGDENRKDASPLYMALTRRLPETLVLTAGFCPLRDEGAAYARKLKSFGVPTEHVCYEDMIHAFLNLENLAKKACESAYRKIGEFLGRP